MTIKAVSPKNHLFVAVQWTGENEDDVADFICAQMTKHDLTTNELIVVKSGVEKILELKDWIMLDEFGSLKTYKDSIFWEIYEEIEKDEITSP